MRYHNNICKIYETPNNHIKDYNENPTSPLEIIIAHVIFTVIVTLLKKINTSLWNTVMMLTFYKTALETAIVSSFL